MGGARNTGGVSWFKFDAKSETSVGIQCGSASTETIITIDSISNRHTYKLDSINNKCFVDDAEYSLNTGGRNENINLHLFNVTNIIPLAN